MKPRHQFNEAVIGLTEAVTALANYTRALKKISGNEAVIGNRDAPDCISAVDVLEKVARQLARAANELRSLYACCGHADWVNNPDRGASFFVSLPHPRRRARVSDETPTVFLVDDDPGIQRALARLLRAGGHPVSAFRSPRDFLAQHDPELPGCVILDLAMPGLNGLELQTALAASGCQRPIIFVSGHGDVPSSVQAMKAGAVDFLTKPVSEEDLLGAVRRAIDRDRLMRQARAELQAIGERFSALTPREREVLQHVVAGQLNKQIAADLGTVEKTVKVHRSRVMEKMGVRSLADLVRVAERIGVGAAAPSAARVAERETGIRATAVRI